MEQCLVNALWAGSVLVLSIHSDLVTDTTTHSCMPLLGVYPT